MKLYRNLNQMSYGKGYEEEFTLRMDECSLFFQAD